MLNLPSRRFPELINRELMIRRVLVLQPMLLLMEEPSLGVSPGLLTKALEAIRKVNVELKTNTIFVQQKVHEDSELARHIDALRMGEIDNLSSECDNRKGEVSIECSQNGSGL